MRTAPPLGALTPRGIALQGHARAIASPSPRAHARRATRSIRATPPPRHRRRGVRRPAWARAASNDCSACVTASACAAPSTATDRSRSEPGRRWSRPLIACHPWLPNTRAVAWHASSRPISSRTGPAPTTAACGCTSARRGNSSRQSTAARGTCSTRRRLSHRAGAGRPSAIHPSAAASRGCRVTTSGSRCVAQWARQSRAC